MTVRFIIFAAAALVLTYAGVGLFRRLSFRFGWYDIPNERSQHAKPVPRGGGIVFAFVCLAAYLVSTAIFAVPFSYGYFLGAILLAAISWIDDLRSLGFIVRFLSHVIVAACLIATTGYWSEIALPGMSPFSLGPAGIVLTGLWVVWTINSYNFMDGIDGLAGLQAFVAGCAWAITACVYGAESAMYFSAAVAAAAAGFLVHNWSPAKIFMGDVGSAFLGFTFAAMPLLLAIEAGPLPVLPVLAVLYLWPFLIDSGITRLRRALRGIRFWEPNREHFYQKMTDAGRPVPLVAAVYGVFAALSAGLGLASLKMSAPWAALTHFMIVPLTAILILAAVRAAAAGPKKEN